jgi:hypothetical protein
VSLPLSAGATVVQEFRRKNPPRGKIRSRPMIHAICNSFLMRLRVIYCRGYVGFEAWLGEILVGEVESCFRLVLKYCILRQDERL